ncbi:DUF4232 domain-containing protein [Streptomyces sp. NPDC004579]|uniref:DUF4232 domain-containing protein n=1 Tax=Streptomyces sp. NPDC004579 TaxID=3154667 RepID=UPI0033A10854
MSVRTARTSRTRFLAATAVALAALTLTACNDGAGVRGEGPSDTSATSARPSGTASDAGTTAGSGTASGSGTTAKRAGDNTAGSSGGSKGTSTSGTTRGSAKKGGGSAKKGGTRSVACDGSTTKTTATPVTRPLNHLLLTVTNTGTGNCDLTGYPIARFGEAQSVPPVAEETHPQAVVTLAPGESGYAGVLLSAADGSGDNGYTAKTLEVGFGRGRGATPALPAEGVYVDDKLTVTYWQQTLDAALTY